MLFNAGMQNKMLLTLFLLNVSTFVSADVREQALRHQVHRAATVQPAGLVQWLALLLATSVHPVSRCWPHGQPPQVRWRPGHPALYRPHHLARPGSGEYSFTLRHPRRTVLLPTQPPMLTRSLVTYTVTGYFRRNLLTLRYDRDILRSKKLEVKFFWRFCWLSFQTLKPFF